MLQFPVWGFARGNHHTNCNQSTVISATRIGASTSVAGLLRGAASGRGRTGGRRTLTQLPPADIDVAKISDLLNCDLLKKHQAACDGKKAP
jgi:hypothetical protein